MPVVLWIIQGLLALAFLAAGSMKAARPIPELAKTMSWAGQIPAPFVRLIGIAEILGAVGLILPAAFHIQSWLTIAASVGLAIVMVSAIVFHLSRKESNRVPINAVLLLLAMFVVIARLTFAQ